MVLLRNERRRPFASDAVQLLRARPERVPQHDHCRTQARPSRPPAEKRGRFLDVTFCFLQAAVRELSWRELSSCADVGLGLLSRAIHGQPHFLQPTIHGGRHQARWRPLCCSGSGSPQELGSGIRGSAARQRRRRWVSNETGSPTRAAVRSGEDRFVGRSGIGTHRVHSPAGCAA